MEVSLSSLLHEYFLAPDKPLWLQEYLGEKVRVLRDDVEAILAVVEGSTRGLPYRYVIQCPGCARLSVFSDDRDEWDEYVPDNHFII